jgi:hypothetical protein
VYDSEEEGSVQGLSPLELIRENGSKTGVVEDEDNEQMIKGKYTSTIFIVFPFN